MRNFLTVLKFKCKQGMGLAQLKNTLRSGPAAVFFLILGMLFIVLISTAILFLYVMSAYRLYLTGKDSGNPALAITVMLTAGQLLLLITGLFSAFHMMFGGKDYNFWASLPIPRGRIFLANLTLSYLTEVGLSLVIVLPLMILYAKYEVVGAAFWPLGLLGIVAFPALPVCVSALLMMLFMTVAGRFRHKGVFMAIGGILLCTGVLAAGMLFDSNTAASASDEILSALGSASGFASFVYFSPSAFFLSGVLSDSVLKAVLSFAALLLLSAGCLGITYRIGKKCYFKVLYKTGETKITENSEKKRRSVVAHSPCTVFFIKEWRLLLRSPVYLLNSLLNVVAGPVLLLAAFSLRSANGSSENAVSVLLDFAARYPSGAVSVILFLTVMAGSFDFAWATTISREGDSVWITKVIPVPVSVQMRGRYLAGYTMYLLCALPMLTLFAVCLKLSLTLLLVAAVSVLAAGAALVAMAMSVDLVRPKIYWTAEAEAIRQNANGLLGMLLALLLSIGLAVPELLATAGFLPDWIAHSLLLLLSFTAAFFSYRIMQSTAKKRYPHL